MAEGNVWNFGMGQLKLWIENDFLYWKHAGKKGSWKISSIAAINFESSALLAEINIYVGGTLAKSLKVPKRKRSEELANDLISAIENCKNN